MEWKFKEGQPIYSQIIDQMSIRIASNAYEPGDKLPSVRDMATDAGVNPNTMQRALGELERRGLVYTERTNGRFVTREEEVLKDLHMQLAEKYIADFFAKLKGLGMTNEEIESAVSNWAQNNAHKSTGDAIENSECIKATGDAQSTGIAPSTGDAQSTGTAPSIGNTQKEER